MATISLVFPRIDMEAEAIAFKQEFFNNGQQTINGSYKLDVDKYSYSAWLKIITDNLHKEDANPKYGTSHTFFAINEEKKIVGVINFRHTLTEFYKDSGHIGYSVRPSERNKGYATEMLRQLLTIAKAHGLSNILLVCKTDNIASIKVITKNEGEITRTFSKDNINYTEYLINL